MKYLFLLLVLAGCGKAEAEKQKSEAVRADAMASADRVLREMNDKDAVAAIVALDNYDSEGSSYNREDGVVPFPKVTINNYLNKANPYLETYKEFFQDQLEFHGQYNDNELFIDLPKLIDINIKLQFALTPDRKNPEKTLIRIITNDKTNYYPLK